MNFENKRFVLRFKNVNSSTNNLEKMNQIITMHIKGYLYMYSIDCAAEATIKQLRKACYKCQNSQHLFIVPRLMETSLHRNVNKATDLIVLLKSGYEAWPIDMYEPLTLAFIFLFIRVKSWQLRSDKPQMMSFASTPADSKLFSMFLNCCKKCTDN
jgi:hypothetical protein